nr:MAG: DNA pilot protein [Microvirus sp.]
MVAVAPPSQLPSAPSGGGGSNFLTGAGAAAGGALSGPLGYGLGAAAGQIAGQAFSSNKVNFRGKYARKQHDFTRWANKNFNQDARDEMTPDMVARVKALDAAGLHRLAALGITPSGSAAQSSPQPMIPGQSDYGSAISDGINTALNVSQNDRMFGLKITEQELRNDWLRTQIMNSGTRRMSQVANEQRPASGVIDGPTVGDDRTTTAPGGQKITIRGGTSAQDLEDQIAEWANLMPSTIGRAYDQFKGEIRDIFGIDQNLEAPFKDYKTPKSEWMTKSGMQLMFPKFNNQDKTRSSGRNPRYR